MFQWTICIEKPVALPERLFMTTWLGIVGYTGPAEGTL